MGLARCIAVKDVELCVDYKCVDNSFLLICLIKDLQKYYLSEELVEFENFFTGDFVVFKEIELSER